MRRAGVLVAGLPLVAVGACSDDDPDARSPSTPSTAEGPVLAAAFTYEVELADGGPTNCPVAEIRFTDTSQGDPTSWEWEFSDRTSSTEQHPIVRHDVYEATLTVRRGDERDTLTQPVSFAVC